MSEYRRTPFEGATARRDQVSASMRDNIGNADLAILITKSFKDDGFSGSEAFFQIPESFDYPTQLMAVRTFYYFAIQEMAQALAQLEMMGLTEDE